MESSPVRDSNEQFPLLNVENGLEAITRKPTSTIRHEVQRLPKILTGYWTGMTLIIAFGLLGYLTLEWPNDPVVYYYDEAPANDRIYFHHIVPALPDVGLYSDFLNDLVSKYPLLQMHIFFLIDDSPSPDNPRPGTLFDRTTYHIQSNKDWHHFQDKHQTFRYSIYRLSLFMKRTPLKHHWKTIPTSYLPFYLRVYTVWKVGGIGIDLDTFNYQYRNYGPVDNRIQAILRNHNDGLPKKDYNKLLQDIEEEEKKRTFSLCAHVLNETISMFSKMFPSIFAEDMRSGLIPFFSPFQYLTTFQESSNDTIQNISSTVNEDERNSTGRTVPLEVVTYDSNLNKTVYDMMEQPHNVKSRQSAIINETSEPNSTVNGTHFSDPEGLRVVAFYDFSVVESHRGTAHLALSSDGSFVAATHKSHNFLSLLLPTSMRRMRPNDAIWITYQTECSNFRVYLPEVYCNIYQL